jgi:Ni/Fe-hydrogenase subunit HybB-like protein
MSRQAVAHTPVGGRLWTRPFALLVLIAAVGFTLMGIRFFNGLASVSNLNDGYPWGLWIGVDVVIGTALGCGGYAVALLAYVFNRGKYHPVIRPAVLTSLLGYGFAMLAVVVDLGRFWSLWKVPVFFWRWTHSPQLEVALCVLTYVLVLFIEISPAVFEKLSSAGSPRLASLARAAGQGVDRALVFILALGILLPTMHQSSLGTMMLLPGPRVHPLWFTAWLPFLFLVNCLIIGYAVVILEGAFSSAVFGRPRHGAMMASLSGVAAWVTAFWIVFRIAEVGWSGELALVGVGVAGVAFLLEVIIPALGCAILASTKRRASSMWRVRAAILLLFGGALFRINTYLVAFSPGPQWSYFPAVPELLITFGMIAAEVAVYIAAVKILPILSGAVPVPARS